MRKIEMTDPLWTRLLGLRGRGGFAPALDESEACLSLYGPIAAASGRFVLAQVGQSLDGRVATPAGDARDISGPEGIAHLHRCRALVEAVMVGVGTVRCDDPQLSVRAVKGPNPVRVIVDCRAELTGEERLFHDGGAPVIVFQSEDSPCRSYPADLIRLPTGPNGLEPEAMLDALAARGLQRLLVEGGARTIARFIHSGLVDRLHVSIAPLIIGSGPMGISLPPIEALNEARRPRAEVFGLGADILFDCHLQSCLSQMAGRQGEQIRMADPA